MCFGIHSHEVFVSPIHDLVVVRNLLGHRHNLLGHNLVQLDYLRGFPTTLHIITLSLIIYFCLVVSNFAMSDIGQL